VRVNEKLNIFKILTMKNLKIKLGLFSLLAVLAASIFLASCEQEQVTNFTPQQEIEYKSQSSMILPLGIATDSKEARDKYIENATSEQIDKMIENARVVHYLRSIDKLKDTAIKMSYADFFCDLDFNSLLTEGEIAGLQNYEINNITSISCICCKWVFVELGKPPYGHEGYWECQCYWCC